MGGVFAPLQNASKSALGRRKNKNFWVGAKIACKKPSKSALDVGNFRRVGCQEWGIRENTLSKAGMVRKTSQTGGIERSTLPKRGNSEEIPCQTRGVVRKTPTKTGNGGNTYCTLTNTSETPLS
jgi:hypothetical protein